MKIQTLHIRNFRSLRDVELQDLRNLNTFVGRNSSGKSNLLEALSIFFSDFSIIGGNTAGLNDYYWYNKNTKKPIEFEINIELSDNEIETIFTPELLKYVKRYSTSLKTLTVKRIITDVQGAWKTITLDCSGLSLIKDNLSQAPNNIFGLLATAYMKRKKATRKVPFPVLSAEQLNAMLQACMGIIKGKFRLFSQIRDVKNPIAHRMTLIDPKLQSSLWTLDQSIKSEEEQKRVEIETSFTSITGKRLDPAQGQVYIRRQQRRFPLHLEGAGIQASIQLLFGLRDEMDKYSVFGIEEPEAHSHSELQTRLFRELKSLSEYCQLFITTHSPTFIDRVDLETAWVTKLVGNETIFKKADELKEIVEELGIRPSDVLFFANQILFVEGLSEEIVIPAFAEKLGIGLEDVAIIAVEGKSKARLNLKTWLKITRGMLPIFLILDKDAETEMKQLETSKLIETGRFHVWERGSIESYYPLLLLEKTLDELNQRYSLKMDVDTLMTKIRSGELSPDKIDLGEKQELLDKKWKVLLAESIARLVRKEEKVVIPEELERALKDAVGA